MKKLAYAFSLSPEILELVRCEAGQKGVSQSCLVEAILPDALGFNDENHPVNVFWNAMISRLTVLGVAIIKNNSNFFYGIRKLNYKNCPSLVIKAKINAKNDVIVLRFEIKTKNLNLRRIVNDYFERQAVQASAFSSTVAIGEDFFETEFLPANQIDELTAFLSGFISGMTER